MKPPIEMFSRWQFARPTVLIISSACLSVLSTHSFAAPAKTKSGLQPDCVNVTGLEEIGDAGFWKTIDRLRQAGISRIRLPLYAEAKVSATAPYQVDRDYLERIRKLAAASAAARISVILDAHDFKSVKRYPERNAPRLTAFWLAASAHWKSLPQSVWFEVLNEPGGNIDARNLASVIKPSIRAIRLSNPKRKIVVGGAWASHFGSLGQTASLMGPNMVPTFHFYDPMRFTHQGASWNDKYSKVKPVSLPSTYTVSISRALSAAEEFKNRTGHIPFVGEIGVIKSVPQGERLRYLSRANSAFRSKGIRTCFWSWPVQEGAFDIRDLLSQVPKREVDVR